MDVIQQLRVKGQMTSEKYVSFMYDVCLLSRDTYYGINGAKMSYIWQCGSRRLDTAFRGLRM